MNPTDFKNKLWAGAQEIETQYGIPALFIIAQAALESGWGKHAIGNNLFGIKAVKWTGKKQLVTTTEYHNTNTVKYPEIISITRLANGKYKYIVKDWFRDYDSLADCLADHARILLLPRYKAAFQYKDPGKFAEEIEKGGYATAPGYAATIKKIIRMIENEIRSNY